MIVTFSTWCFAAVVEADDPALLEETMTTLKTSHLLVAAALALAPAGAAFADAASLAAAKEAKIKAKADAILAAKKAAEEEMARKAKENADRANRARLTGAASAADENKTHQQNLGIIERLEQVAAHTGDATLAAKVATLKIKEERRHQLAS